MHLPASTTHAIRNSCVNTAILDTPDTQELQLNHVFSTYMRINEQKDLYINILYNIYINILYNMYINIL